MAWLDELFADMDDFFRQAALSKYGNRNTRYVDRRDEVKVDRLGKTRDKSDSDAGRSCDRSSVDAVVIHMMELARDSEPTRFDGIKAHFAVLRSGTILHLHDQGEYLFASHDFNCRSIAVEFEGNYPYRRNSLGQLEWWSDRYTKPRAKQDGPTVDQIAAGRALIRYFREVLRLSNIYGHRQSCEKVCPGPQLWYNLVKWGVDQLGLSDGGAGHTTSNDFCDGAAVPAHWRDSDWSIDTIQSSPSTFVGPAPTHGGVCVPP